MNDEFIPRPPEAVDCLACGGEGNPKLCDHEECQDLEGCLFDICEACDGRGWIN